MSPETRALCRPIQHILYYRVIHSILQDISKMATWQSKSLHPRNRLVLCIVKPPRMMGVTKVCQPDLARRGVRRRVRCPSCHGNGRPARGNGMSKLNGQKNVGPAGARTARPPTSRPWPNGLDFLSMRPSNRQHGADEPSALRHPLSSQTFLRASPRTPRALDKK